MARLIGTGATERVLSTAALLAPAEAQRLGLLDELAPPERLLVRTCRCTLGVLVLASGWLPPAPAACGRRRSPLRSPPAAACPGPRPRQAAAEAQLGALLAAPDASRSETKRLLRGEYAAAWVAYACGEEADYAWDLLASPPVVAQLAAVRERLAAGARHKPRGGGGGGGGEQRSRL